MPIQVKLSVNIQTKHQKGEKKVNSGTWPLRCSWCQMSCLEISESADLLGFSCAIVSRVYEERCETQETSSKWQFWWEVRREWADRLEATVTQITTTFTATVSGNASQNAQQASRNGKLWTAEDHMGVGSFSPRTGNWSYTGHSFTETGRPGKSFISVKSELDRIITLVMETW